MLYSLKRYFNFSLVNFLGGYVSKPTYGGLNPAPPSNHQILFILLQYSAITDYKEHKKGIMEIKYGVNAGFRSQGRCVEPFFLSNAAQPL